MIASVDRPHSELQPREQIEPFVSMLPAIRRYASFTFRHLRPEAREEAVAEVVANAFVAFSRLTELGKADLAYPNVLARYGAFRFREGRRVGNKSNVADVLSPYCQRRKRVVVEPLEGRLADGSWREMVVEDRRATPAEVASFRIDFANWLASLSPAKRRVAELLVTGETTGRVARIVSLSAARISQMRRELRETWHCYVSSESSTAPALT